MTIDLMVWAPTREQFIAGMVQNRLATFEDGVLLPTDGVQIDEIGPICKTPAVLDEEGDVLEPAVMVGGWHANLRAYGEFAAQVSYGLPQDGDVFQRTHLLQLVPDLELTEATQKGVPAGHSGPNEVRLFDPSVVAIPARVWA